MPSAEIEVLSTLRFWQAQGQSAALATVVRTYGSSPRPAGSLVAIRADGAVIGSVSGGCIEQDLIERVRMAIPALPQRLVYGGAAEENRRWSMPCGGQMELVLESAPSAAILDQLLAALHARQPIARRLDLASGVSTLFTPSATTRLICDEQQLIIPHGPQLRLLIIGAVQTARYLAEMAAALDYTVLVCDPREEYRLTWNVPGSELLDGMPDDAITAMQPDAYTAIVALTHDPKLDDMALMEALRSPAFYVGALGSKRNNTKRRERLALLDLAADDIARLRGPVGLPIGSRTPPEIAVAILADLIAVRNGIELIAASAPTLQPQYATA
ncbi:MAG: XdhC family protein [Burkholderiales bacterium]|nr:XdhC family protein [Burkholderiales bacterium]